MPTEPLLTIGRTNIYVLKGPKTGDITKCGADVLVSSAGTGGTMSSGVSKAILDRGGSEIKEALSSHKPLIPGDVVITSAGKLAAKNIYHAVVVSWGDQRKVLQAAIWRAVSRCMELAQLTNMTSIAFPSLGTGSGKADRFETHSTMSAACLESLRSGGSLRSIHFCFDYRDTGQTFQKAFLQQQLIRQAHGLTMDDQADLGKLVESWQTVWPEVLGLGANLDRLAQLVTRLEQDPSARVVINVGDIINSTASIGPWSVAVGGNVKDSTIATADGARVETAGAKKD
jgi:O-acetyl-ADP-ribose deacetylase (regulator of RNase III)